MKLPETIQSERGVSPVIGVILMVAITVILAAVIGSFVLGIGGNVEQTPQASLSVEANSSGYITIAHEGGDTLNGDDLNATVGGSNVDMGFPSQFSPGQSVTKSTSPTPADGDTVRVIHTPTGGMIIQTDVRI